MLGVSFLSPLFLAGLAAAAIPIAIHLFHRRTEPVIDFAAMRFLRRAPVEHSRRRRLRELLLLALRVAALCLLALSFARPYLAQSAAALSAPVLVVLVDTSVSMTAPGQFERAREAAAKAIRGASAGQSVGVLTFANSAEVVVAPSQDRQGALAAVARLQPGAGATRYRTALARAVETIGDRGGRFVVVTDLQQSAWDAADEGAVPDRVEVDVSDVGAPAGNVAVTSLRIDGTEAVALVHNYSERPRREQVAFGIDGRRFANVAVTVPAAGSVEARASIEGRTRGVLESTVTDAEGYAADNRRYAVLDAVQSPAVLAITATGQASDVFYLERAVLVAEDAGGFRFRAMSGPAFSGLTSEALVDVGAVLVLGTRGVDARGRQLLAGYVKGGGGLLIAGGPDVDPKVLGEALAGIVPSGLRERPAGGALRFAPDDSRHPVFRLLGGVGTLANVTFARASGVDAAPSAEVIARYTDGSPALLEDRATGGRVLIFTSDLNNRWNDFPVQPAFVPFVHEMLRYLATARASRVEYVVGELPGPAGAAPGVMELRGIRDRGSGIGDQGSGIKDQGTGIREPRSGTRSPISDPRSPIRRVAVNVDPGESDPARVTSETFRDGIARLHASAALQARVQAHEREDSQRFWQYGLLLMVVSLAAEGMLGRRLG